MERELRRVPSDWQHPRDDRWQLKPLHDRDYESALLDWIESGWRFVAGGSLEYGPTDEENCPRTWAGYAEWFGDAPEVEYHRPKWVSEPTHYQVYETVSQGTPVSPVLSSKQAVVEWWMFVGDSFDGTLSREQAERWVELESSPSFAITDGQMISGAKLSGTASSNAREGEVVTKVVAVKVVDIETNEVVHRVEINPPVSPDSRKVDRVEDGLSINLNHARFFTELEFEGEVS